MKRFGVLLLLAATALAGGQGDAAAIAAIRDYYISLRSGQDGLIQSVRDRLVPVMNDLSPKTGKSIRNVIRRGFDKKYKKDLAYLTCLCQILAAGGKPAINILYKQYGKSKKNDELCVVMAESLGNCGDDYAVGPLLKMMYDKDAPVAVAAVKGLANYARVAEKKRKEAVKTMTTHFSKVTDAAAGKAADTPQMQTYRALKDPLNAALQALTGEQLNSAAAWKAWLAENLSRSWE